MFAPGIVRPHRQKREDGHGSRNESTALSSLSSQLLQATLERRAGWTVGITAREGGDAAFQEGHISACQLPQVIETRFIKGLERFGQPNKGTRQSTWLWLEG